jgi:hypothetical protein
LYEDVRSRLLAVLLVACACLAACGGGGGGGSKKATGAKGASGELAAETASFDLAVGPPARYMLGILTQDQRGVSFGTVQIRFCFLGAQQASGVCRYGTPQQASFVGVPGSPPAPPGATPQVISSTESKGVYATQAAFDKAGFWRAEVALTLDGKQRQATTDFQVLEHHAIAAVGDQALPTDNLTASTPNTPPAAVDSRASAGGLIPDPELHQTTIAAALAAHRPVLAVFATPVYCVSRFCGPTTDMVQQLAKTYGDRASFVHVEIWHDFQKQQVNKAAADWLFRNDNITEPWVFLIGADGKIAARWDNVADEGEIASMLKALPVIGKG